MILSASRRTDIPCYYGEWLVNRLKAGYVQVRNPMNPAQIRRVPLSPETVDAIVFWTKDPEPMIPLLDKIDAMGYRYYFQFTLTPYDRTLEPHLRDKTCIIRTFAGLSRRIGRDRVLWRYDPILLNDTLDMAYHREQFRRLCDVLSPYTPTVTISFVDMYAKIISPLVRIISEAEMLELAAFFGETAGEFGLGIRACCEAADLTPCGIHPASCIDPHVLKNLCGRPLHLPRDRNQRPGCGCVASIDIGAYNTCRSGCVYCYANSHGEKAPLRRQKREYRPDAEML